MKSILRLIFFLNMVFLLFSSALLSQSADEFSRSATTLKRIRGDIQRKTLQVLILLKGIDSSAAAQQEKISVIKPTAQVFESNTLQARVIFTARINDEFNLLEKRDEWYRIRLQDRREGWIQESEVQSISSSATTQVQINDVLQYCSTMKEDILVRYDSAMILIASIEDSYRSLSKTDQTTFAQQYAESKQERDKVTEYVEYVRLFTAKYASRKNNAGIVEEGSSIPIQGQASVQLGNSAYNTTYDPILRRSMSSSTIDISGTGTVSEHSTVNAQINYQSTIIQTPFSSGYIRLGYTYLKPEGLNFGSYAAFGSYTDDSLKRNSFSRIGAGANVRYPFNQTTALLADVSFEGRSYKEDKTNDYNGVQLTSQLKWKAGRVTDVSVGLNGAVQSSDISYLKFNRVIPHFQYLTRDGNSSFAIKTEADILSYAPDAKTNDYTREHIDLLWTSSTVTRQLYLSAKQFTNNTASSYVRLGNMMRWNSQNGVSYNRSSMHVYFNYFTNKEQFQSDFADFRIDHATSGQTLYYDANIFSRVWFNREDSIMRDHVIDAYTRIGAIFPYVQVGPFVGAHLLVRKTEKLIERDGNSLRAGIEATSNFTVYTASISINIRYEKNFVYGRELSIDPNTGITTEGNLRERHPTTFQASGRVRVPIIANLDFMLDVNRYDINPDVDNIVSINPYERRMQFNLLAGLTYRFGL